MSDYLHSLHRFYDEIFNSPKHVQILEEIECLTNIATKLFQSNRMIIAMFSFQKHSRYII